MPIAAAPVSSSSSSSNAAVSLPLPKSLPARLILVRHGEREDHVNPKWKLDALRPHDSPLSERGHRQARDLGRFYFARLLDVAYALQAEADSPSGVTASLTNNAAQCLHKAQVLAAEHPDECAQLSVVSFLMSQIVFWSSPLTRCVETSHGIATQMHEAAVETILGGFSAAACEAAATRKAIAAAIPMPSILIEDALAEEDKWMYFDMKSAPLVAKHGPPKPILHDAAHHAANTSPLVNPSLSVRPSRLCPTTFDYPDGKHVEEVVPRTDNRKKLRQRPIDERVKAAVGAFMSGPASNLGLAPSSLVFLVSHGKTSTEYYNELLRAAASTALANGSAHLEANRKVEYFHGSIHYTGFAEFSWVPEHNRYTPSSAPFQTPHLPPTVTDD